jgi:hypothetical protein
MGNISDKNCREEQNTHVVFNNYFSRKSRLLLDNAEEKDTARQATDAMQYGSFAFHSE